ncbi:unnamed protein product [Effrenium voratum]|nr:unnamed protein product [Effrenium voratum]
MGKKKEPKEKKARTSSIPDITLKGMVVAALAVTLPPLLALVWLPPKQATDDGGFLPTLPKNLWSAKCPAKPAAPSGALD